MVFSYNQILDRLHAVFGTGTDETMNRTLDNLAEYLANRNLELGGIYYLVTDFVSGRINTSDVSFKNALNTLLRFRDDLLIEIKEHTIIIDDEEIMV